MRRFDILPGPAGRHPACGLQDNGSSYRYTLISAAKTPHFQSLKRPCAALSQRQAGAGREKTAKEEAHPFTDVEPSVGFTVFLYSNWIAAGRTERFFIIRPLSLENPGQQYVWVLLYHTPGRMWSINPQNIF